MSSKARSAEGQLALLNVEAAKATGLLKHGEFTAERYEREHPEECDKVCFLFGEGPRRWSVSALAGTFGRSVNTIRALLNKRGLLSVDALRGRVRETCQVGALALADRVAAAPESVPWSQVPMMMDVMVRTAQLMEGGPTEIREDRVVHVNVEDWNARLRAARAAEMGFGEGGKGALREGAAAGGQVIDVVAEMCPVVDDHKEQA